MTLNGGMYEEDLEDPESLNYMFNHQGLAYGQGATQSTGGFGDINGSFGTDGAAILDNGSTYNKVLQGSFGNDGGYDARSTMGAQSPPSVLSIIAPWQSPIRSRR